jgi:hypothetical protein
MTINKLFSSLMLIYFCMYFVTGKSRGPFSGPYGAYYEGYWLKINYPNSFDAERGKAPGAISFAQQKRIQTSWSKRERALEGAKLGGGIGFQGWIKEWNNAGPRHLSWGCVLLHLYDITELYDQIPPGAMVVIF